MKKEEALIVFIITILIISTFSITSISDTPTGYASKKVSKSSGGGSSKGGGSSSKGNGLDKITGKVTTEDPSKKEYKAVTIEELPKSATIKNNKAPATMQAFCFRAICAKEDLDGIDSLRFSLTDCHPHPIDDNLRSRHQFAAGFALQDC